MDENGTAAQSMVLQTTRSQLRHFQDADPRCRALQLPEGIMLRYNLTESLYFYLRTGVTEGKLHTRIYASDSPYDRLKTDIGEVTTPMFEPQAEAQHLQKLEQLLHKWVDFVSDDPDLAAPFTSFPVRDHKE